MKLFVGCYTETITEELVGKGMGIYCLDFNKSNGQLKLLDVTPALNPSYLTISNDGNYLYAIEEIPIEKSPKIKAYSINSEGSGPSLTLIKEQNLPGSYACHLSLTNSQTHLAVASYMSGNILVYPLDEYGGLLPLSQNLQHQGSGPNKERQEAPHAHMIYPYGANGIFVVDLGLDIAKAYELQGSSGQMIEVPESDISIRKGAGARHMVMHPEGGYAFIFSELSAEVFSFRVDDKKFEFLESVNTLPVDYFKIPSGAAIRMHPSGKFVYVSNRGHNSITIFRFDQQSGKLSLVGYEPSGGTTPREINIDHSGRWLIAANQDSDNIVVFKIDQDDGMLKMHYINEDVKTACCIQFLEG